MLNKMPKSDESASMQAWNCYAIWTKVNGHYIERMAAHQRWRLRGVQL